MITILYLHALHADAVEVEAEVAAGDAVAVGTAATQITITTTLELTGELIYLIPSAGANTVWHSTPLQSAGARRRTNLLLPGKNGKNLRITTVRVLRITILGDLTKL